MSLTGLDGAAIAAKLDAAVAVGEQLPRAAGQSLTHGHLLPSIVD